MHTTHLRKVGGSLMLAVPPAILDMLRLTAGAAVGMQVADGKLVIEPRARPRYTLDELLAQCDAAAAPDPADEAWLESPRIGDELL